jgi:hypothetical protein
MPSLRSINQTVRRLGIPDGPLWALSRIISIVSGNRCRLHRYYFVAQPVRDAPLARAERTPFVSFRAVEAADPLTVQFPRPADVIARRYAIGALCLAAEREHTFIGFIWLKERSYPEDEVRCCYVLEPAHVAVWDFDVYIDPAYRAGRTFARLWDSANEWMRQRGYRWTLSRISAFNPDSLAAHRRLGTRRIGSATFLCMASVQIAMLDHPPFLHVGWRESQFPSVRLHPPVSSLN